MRKHTILLLVTLTAFAVTEAREVTREGIMITVPDGKWKQWSDTCTGDWGWQREGIGFSVGTRRYLMKDREWRASGDLCGISSFDDLRAEVVAPLRA